MTGRPGIPMPTLRRLPLYYRRLTQALDAGETYISSEVLGQDSGVPGAQVRKELSYLADEGRPGVGYEVKTLAADLEAFLGLVNDKEAGLVGGGNLGRALASYPGFARYGLQIVALFDEDPAKIGQVYGERPVLPVSKLTDLAQRLHIQMGIITVPACSAQQVADMMVAGGVRVIWNFAPCALAAPEHILVKNEDLASELAMLSHHISQRAQREARS